ncbi:autotransporter outer membrane beta-barrel domain-containing protein [Budvicia aquatica]|nr:autotransporter outer membrane beta-barrel domain-containing protein [Budvicia aquatica]
MNINHFNKNSFTQCLLSIGFILPFAGSVSADANVACGDGATLAGTVFGGTYTPSNNCGNNVTITTSGTKYSNSQETSNTNGIYFAQNGTHPDFIFGTGLTVSTTGNNVDLIKTNGSSGDYGSYTVMVGDNATLTATGTNSNGINIAQSANAGSGYGRVYLGQSSSVNVKSGVAVRVNLTSQAPYYNLAYIGDNSTIQSGGTGTNNQNALGYAVYAGNRDDVLTNGTASGTNAVAIIGSGSTIKTIGNNGHAVYANKGGVIQLQGSAGAVTVSTDGAGADALRAEKKLTAGNNFNALGGKIELTGDTTITVAQPDSAYAMHALGEGSVIASSQTNYYTGSVDKLYDGAGTMVNDAAKVTASTSGIYHITGNLLAESGLIDVTMTDTSHFTGITHVDVYSYSDAGGATTTDEKGVINLHIDGANSIWNMVGDSELTHLTLTGSTLKYSEPLTGTAFTPKTLTVDSHYNANNGTLVLNTVLEGDTSATDKLIVNGNTSGHTNVLINNIGGQGALTTHGIEIVEVYGNSVGTFNSSGRIVAGAFDYFVRPGTAISGANAKNWYLISDDSPTIPPVIPPVDPTPEVPEVPVIQPVAPELPTTPVVNAPVYRPEAGSYLANQAAANTLFMTRLHDRLGETQYTDILTGEQKVTSLWMRHVGGHNRFRDESGQLKTTSNRYVLQLGGDIAQWSNNGLDRVHLGVMAGYGSNNSKTQSNVTGYASKGNVNGYSVGVYGTWYGNQADKTGVYVDSWALYNWFDNDVKGDYLGTENYQSRGVTASVESGYTVKLGQHEQDTYWLQPKAQVVWMGVSAHDRRERNGTEISHETDANVMTRLGVRAYMNGHHRSDDGKDRTFQPFIEANWIHNTESDTVRMNHVSNRQAGANNIGELKIGVEGQLNMRLNVWGNVAQQLGDKGYSDTQALLGIKYSF